MNHRPNPNSGAFNVSSDIAGEINVYSAAGNLVHTESIQSGETQININLKTGIYHLQLKTSDRVSNLKLLVTN